MPDSGRPLERALTKRSFVMNGIIVFLALFTLGSALFIGGWQKRRAEQAKEEGVESRLASDRS